MSWYVLYTKPRNEKKITTLLQDKGIEVYCPLHEVVKQWSDRKKKVQEPVFSSYVFVNLEDYKQESIDVLCTPGAVRFLWLHRKPGIVRDFEIEAIQEFLEDYKGAEIQVSLAVGENIKVNEGPLKDAEGKVLNVKGNKVTLHLHTLGLNMVAKLPAQALSKVGR